MSRVMALTKRNVSLERDVWPCFDILKIVMWPYLDILKESVALP